MREPEPFLVFVDKLAELGVPYMVTGSVAALLYGEPRLTHDVDVVVDLASRAAIHRLPELFPDDAFYCPPLEVIVQEASRRQRGHFKLIEQLTGLKADVYLANEDPLALAGLQRRRSLEVGGRPLVVAPPEYVVVRKLEFFREGGSEKHLRDIEGILRVSGELVDEPWLEGWVRRLGLEALWARCRDHLGPLRG
ncbi:MAG TPA: hypothetical protein PLU22_01690 [Polyangiaceae bacterium]|nr:hypothetical protein [Polyangiaceae bacterium]